MKRFDIDVERWSEKTGEKMEDLISAALVKLNTDVITATPVDTGTARGGWVPSLGAPSGSKGKADKAGGATISRANAKAKKAAGKIYYLTNNIVYIRHLEYGLYPNPPKVPTGKTKGGYSRQAPRGMVRVAMARLKKEIAKV